MCEVTVRPICLGSGQGTTFCRNVQVLRKSGDRPNITFGNTLKQLLGQEGHIVRRFFDQVEITLAEGQSPLNISDTLERQFQRFVFSLPEDQCPAKFQCAYFRSVKFMASYQSGTNGIEIDVILLEDIDNPPELAAFKAFGWSPGDPSPSPFGGYSA